MTESEWLKCNSFESMMSFLFHEKLTKDYFDIISRDLAQEFSKSNEYIKIYNFWKNSTNKEIVIELNHKDRKEINKYFYIDEYKTIQTLHEVIGNPFVRLNQCKICSGTGFKINHEILSKLDYDLKIETFKEYCKNCLGTCKDVKWINQNIKDIFKVVLKEKKFEDNLILADACEDAGCLDVNILMHLRDKNIIHNNHCWVIREIMTN